MELGWDDKLDWKIAYETVRSSLRGLSYIDDRSELLYLAAGNGHDLLVNLLLQDRRADPTVRNNIAIRLASENGHAKIVELLLEDGRADPNALDGYCLKHAMEERHYEVVCVLV